MNGNKPAWQFDLEAYIREGEPSEAQRAENWQTAIGLQAVDGLQISKYLLETAKDHIEGRISIDEAGRRIESYYEERALREDAEAAATEEADKVSSRISKLLGEKAFTFSPAQLQAIHRALFDGILPRAGKYRTYNITKREWVLAGDTVFYASCDSIPDTLKYDFGQERVFDYRGMDKYSAARHIAAFVSGVWQIHPFAEGNTRTTAVFAIKYLTSLGYNVDNSLFKENSWYFRNALVRANYENIERGIHADQSFLDAFFDNLLFGGTNELKNRYMHVEWDGSEGFIACKKPDDGLTDQVADQVTDQVTDQVAQLLDALGDEELTAQELMGRVGLSHRPTFSSNYLNPALAAGLVERTVPDKPTSRFQKYRKTAK